MKKILFVTARYPWPIITGDALRAYNQIKELARNNTVDVFSLEHIPEVRGDIDEFISWNISGKINKVRKFRNLILNGYDRAIQCAMYADQESWLSLKKLIGENKYDAIIFQLIRLEYVISKTIVLKYKLNLKAKIYCDYVDALSLNMASRAKTEGALMKFICNRESSKLLASEQKIYSLVDHSLIISERDANYIGIGNFKILPNGVNIPKHNFEDEHKKLVDMMPPINLVFFGNMGYYPNVNAALFLADIFQKLTPGKYKLHIVGAQPAKKILSLKAVDGIMIHGYVENLYDLLSNMDLAVFPILDGSGLQNKVLEAFALKLPVITTDIVLASIPKLKDYAISANTKEDFIKEIEAFTLGDVKWNGSVTTALSILKEEYSWNKITLLV
ncbi:glycosyltransferase [Xenorhabdus bovienii]|uniref:WfbV n=1 Tax=Xenorhabdus bovienii str. Intermedium TaxID=1379677 RepID=A0A077QLE1_XENBV|nr:glycosyltransferase [Xenorhabdus bovienii]CDH34419.1 WfbV [Xenorhabdus bovienii str. Intermedium]